jgi:hypothetical protein
MGGVNDIRAHLGAARESLDEGERLLQQASAVAGDLKQSAAIHGWSGVERAMSDCQEELEEATLVIGGALGAAVDGVAALAGIPDEMSSDEVAARLSTVGELLDAALTHTEQSLESIGEARNIAEQADATTVVELADAAETALTTGQGLVKAATTTTDAEQSDASAWGDSARGTVGSSQSLRVRHIEERELSPERLLDDPQSASGQSPEAVQRVLDEHLDPERWTRAPLKRGEGTRWYDRKGRSIAIERQRQVNDLLHQGWYLKVANNGRIDRIPLAGNPVLGDERQT